MMELRNLKTFLSLSKHRNFTKTAQALGYAQSSISMHIQQLENELHVTLFERMGKHVFLTPDGERLLPYAEQIMELHNNAEHIYEHSGQTSLRIGICESLCIEYLPRIVRPFKQKHPDVEIYISLLAASDIAAVLSSYKIDLAFILDKPIDNLAVKTSFQQKEEIFLYCRPDHPLALKQQLSERDFIEVPLLLTGPTCPYRRQFMDILYGLRLKPKIALEADSIPAIKTSAVMGLGICLLPALSVRNEIEAGELVKLDYQFNSQIYTQLVYHKDKWITPQLKDFMDAAKENFMV